MKLIVPTMARPFRSAGRKVMSWTSRDIWFMYSWSAIPQIMVNARMTRPLVSTVNVTLNRPSGRASWGAAGILKGFTRRGTSVGDAPRAGVSDGHGGTVFGRAGPIAQAIEKGSISQPSLDRIDLCLG